MNLRVFYLTRRGISDGYEKPPIKSEFCRQKVLMFCLNENNIYHLYSQGIDMRKGVEGLCGIIRTYQYSPTNQEVYVFANKSRTLVKMLHWERGGFVVYYKRLEQGRLSPSIFHHKNATAFIDIRWDEMVLLMEGIRLGIKRRKRYNIIRETL